MIVEHSAILISKILKTSHGHFSFDRWCGPVPPTVMSQQWPAPERKMKWVRISHGLWSDGSGDAALVRVPVLQLRPNGRDEVSHWNKGHHSVIKSHCPFVLLQSYVLFSVLILLILDLITLHWNRQMCFPSAQSCFLFLSPYNQMTLSRLGKIYHCSGGRRWRDIKMEAGSKNDSGRTLDIPHNLCLRLWWWWPSFSTVRQ